MVTTTRPPRPDFRPPPHRRRRLRRLLRRPRLRPLSRLCLQPLLMLLLAVVTIVKRPKLWQEWGAARRPERDATVTETRAHTGSRG